MPLATWSGALPPDMRLPAPPRAPVLQAFAAGKENERTNEPPHHNIIAASRLFAKAEAEKDDGEVKLQSSSCFIQASDAGAFLAAEEEVLQPPEEQPSEEDLVREDFERHLQSHAAAQQQPRSSPARMSPARKQPREEDLMRPHQEQPSEEKLVREDFERRLQSGEGDVVATWCGYVQWVSQRAPKSAEESTVIRRACTSLVAHPQHRDDIRYLRLWVRRAASQAEPHDIFNLLEQYDIGTRHALRYEAVAAELERKHRFPEAEAQYTRGLEVGAEPSDRLQKRFKEFQARMQKRMARKQCTQASKVPGEADVQSRTTETQPRPEVEQVQRHAQAQDHQPPPNMVDPLGGFSQALLEDVSWEEEQAARVFARLSQRSADFPRPHVELRDEDVACFESDNRTQELTTGGVLALLGDDATGRSSRRSSAASGFFGAGEDVTYTTELAKREVLELLAHDPLHRSRQSKGNEGSALQPLIFGGVSDSQARSSQLCSQPSGRNPASAPAFEIFEESDSEGRS